MIKMISFNNFENFDGKTNASSEAERDATAQNFTAILSGFAPIRTKPEDMPANNEMSMKKNVSGAQADIEAFKNFMFPPQNFKVEKTTTGDQIKNGASIETISRREETSIHKNKMMPEQLAHLYQNEDPTVKQNSEIINGKIQVNHLYQPDTTKEMAADAPVKLPILQNGVEKIAPPANQETFAEYPLEGRILTQFDNTGSKVPSMWSRDQSVPREIPNVLIPNIANLERRESSLRFVINQDNILDIPANDFPPINAGIKENPILTFETGKVEDIEILSVKSTLTKEFKNNFSDDILEFPEIQTAASEKIVEIKTDKFQLLDLTQSETSEIPQGIESKINADSVQFKNLKYFFNSETNRVDEVKNQPLNNLTNLYDKVSEIVREDAVSEKVRAEIEAAEIRLENQVVSQVEDLWAGYSNDNQVFTTNSIRGSYKPREVFSQNVHTTNSIRENTSRSDEIFNELGVTVANDNSNSQDFAKPQMVNSATNPAMETADFNNPSAVSQNPQTLSQINLTQAEKPIPKPDKPLEISAKISDLSFEKFLNPAVNDAEIIKVTPNSLIEDSVIFEQIEPKIIELAKSVDKTGETDLLKMRLNPAELGEIEIRLEKDASGKINAHIQTETEATRHILSESLGQLRESLQNAGWQVEKLEVSYNANQSNGNEHRENSSREFETEETGRKNAFGFDGNLENKDDQAENPSDRLVNLRA